MAFSSTTLRALISCPGDVMPVDLAVVHQAITRWNVLWGEQVGHVVIPVSWSEHAAAEFGEPPQDILNRQLVDVVDLGIAIFWSRLGTPTDNAESGTAEEIKRLADAGRPVSVLRCNRPVPPNGDHAERARLDEYLKAIFGQALVVSYDSDARLASQVDTILTRMVTSHENDWAVSGGLARSGRGPRTQVVPRIESSRDTESDSQGRLKIRIHYQLIFENRGLGEARDIKWSLSGLDGAEGDLPWIGDDRESGSGRIPVLAGGAQIPYSLTAHYGMTDVFLCRVEWTEDGMQREVETTLRLP
jgi:hypothetical protein